MNVHEFEGKNEEEAISKAIEALGLDREDIDVEIVEAKKSAFLFGGGKVRIRVHLDEDKQPDDYRHPDAWQTPGARGQRPQRQRDGRSGGRRPRSSGPGGPGAGALGPRSDGRRSDGRGSRPRPGGSRSNAPRSDGARRSDGRVPRNPSRGAQAERGSGSGRYVFDRADLDLFDSADIAPVALVALEPENDFERRILEFLEGLFEHLGMTAQVRIVFREDKKLGVDVDSPDSAIVIGKRGQTLEAIQTVTNVVSSRMKNGSPRVVVDSQNYRLRRERGLVRIAQEVAEEVRRTRQSRLLEAMNPFERRLIHTTLSAEADIQTASEGEGLYKRVRVLYRGQK